MHILQQELVSLVFNQLVTADDLLRCAAVSKTWAAAAIKCQLQTLRFNHRTQADTEVNTACHKLRLLQTWHREGRLQSLRKLCVDVDPKSANTSLLFQGLFVLAGFWNLSSCSVDGPFCLEAALGLLPTSLLKLDLWPGAGPKVIRLSTFKRFSRLQTLKLAVGLGDGEEDEAETPSYQLLLDTALSCLRHVVIHDGLLCELAQAVTIETCFSHVRSLQIHVRPDQKGRNLVEGVLALQKLQFLALNILTESSPPWDLIVPKSSSIQYLVLTAEQAPTMTVQLQKPDIQFCCSGVIWLDVETGPHAS